MPTPATDLRPTRREILGRYGTTYIVELRSSMIVMRPKGTRRGGKQEVVLLPGLIYQRALRERVDAERAERKKLRRQKAR